MTTEGSGDMDDVNCSWEYSDVLSQKLSWERWAVNNTVDLLDKGNTIPFIARYRKEQTNNMQSETLRRLSDIYDDLRTVRQKINTAVKSIQKQGKLTQQLKCAFAAAQTKAEIEQLYAPYKTGSKRSLAERARELGLEDLAIGVLTRHNGVNIHAAVNPNKKGVATLGEVETGIQHIIADIIYKNKETMDYMRQLCQQGNIVLQSTRIKAKQVKTESSKNTDKMKVKVKSGEQIKNVVDPEKFHLYFDFRSSVKSIRPHQVLAVNRGESLKVLRVKVDIPDWVSQQLKTFCHRRWPAVAPCHHKLFDSSIDDAYNRLIQPIMVSNIRSDLTREAEKASIDVFAQNLKQLLLTPPVRGRVVMGVDPGFRNGCKFAVTSATGNILDTGVAYLHTRNHRGTETDMIRRTLLQHRCDTIAIGNGTACRETECFFSDQIKQGTFAPLNVVYCIVSEAGASIYSASPEAEKELPDMDVTLRGAVSIAKRLQDPLAELVKIEPRHIGVGMYQHDVSESKLKTSLEGVVEDCVNFTGIDLNTTSEVLLMRIAGLGKVKAHKIIEWRNSHGPFLNRAQLNSIKGLGPKAYEQCAGFVRILPETRAGVPEKNVTNSSEEKVCVGRKRKAGGEAGGSKVKRSRLKKDTEAQVESLDMTAIHPESYHVADSIILKLGLSKDCIGQDSFISRVKASMCDVQRLAKEQNVGIPTMQLILDALVQPIGRDIRDEFEKPLFRQSVTTIESVNVGMTVTGRISNTTHFGAFVDIGVGRDALLHTSQMGPMQMNGRRQLSLGDRIEVSVMSIDRSKGRIGLKLLKVM